MVISYLLVKNYKTSITPTRS